MIPNLALCRLAAAEHSSQQGTRTTHPITIPNLALRRSGSLQGTRTAHSIHKPLVPDLSAYSKGLNDKPLRYRSATTEQQQTGNRSPPPGYSGGAISWRQTPVGGDPAGGGLFGPTITTPTEAMGFPGFCQGHRSCPSLVIRACVRLRTRPCRTHRSLHLLVRHDPNQEGS